MKACVDVDYRDACAVAACVVFDAWGDAAPAYERRIVSASAPAAYEPGAFYKRELPYLLAVLEGLDTIDLVVVDGYVWLDGGRPGLGAHLYEALGRRVAVVGVAKTAFRGATATAIHRGTSKHPLHVGAVGIESALAATGIAGMFGPHRMPTLLTRVDMLSRL